MSARKEIAAAAMVMMSLSFKVMLTLASVNYNIRLESDIFYDNKNAQRYQEEGVAMVPKGCQGKCGDVYIRYPFGIGSSGCYLNKWFRINCTKSSNGAKRPFLMSSFSGDRKGVRREILTFLIFGCGGASLGKPGEEFKQMGCTLNCSSKTTLLKTADDCQGINCCQLPFDQDVQTYHVNFTRTDSSAACNYAFFFGGSTLPDSLQRFPSRQQEKEVVVPVVWKWTITKHDLPYLAPSFIVDYCHTYYDDESYHCYCQYPEGGNVYLPHGCKKMYGRKISLKKLSAIIGVSASFGFLLLLWACFILYKAIKKRKIKKLRQKFFKRNGGLLLQQQLLTKEGTIEKAKIFTASELDKATDHFNANRIVGRGGQGTVYKGMLIDGQIVAPISFEVDDDEDRSLVTRFLLCMEENNLWEILDVEVSEQGKKEDVMAIAWLAQRCLNYNGKKRPTMKEVAAELDAIRASNPHLALAMKTLETESVGYMEDEISIVPKGCRDTCGNVSIYYPFGIGPNKHCFLNKWYLINCTKSSNGAEKPYLSSFSDGSNLGTREILEISDRSETITIEEWFSPLCQTTTRSAVGSNNLSIISNTKLSGSPFFYSSDDNRFMFYGCGRAVLTTPHVQEFTMAACKLNCSSNNTKPAPEFADDDCNGINCCQLRFDYNINAYQINITDSSIVNASCNYAFFLANSYSSSFSLQSSGLLGEKLVVPVVWRWTVTRDDFTYLPPHYSLHCYQYDNIFPPQLQGTYWNCRCKDLEHGNAYLPNGCQVMAADRSTVEAQPIVPKSCRDKCGNVSIYYPFGIGIGNGGSKSCYLNKWFLINCTQSLDGSEKPYLSSIFGRLEILGISFDSQTITIKESISPSCQPAKGNNFSIIQNSKLSETPFFYSYGNNFMLFGCGNAFITMPGEELEQHGYKLNCSSKNTEAPKTAHDCQGINCNHLTVDYDVNTYQVNFTHDSFINGCNYAFFSASSSLPHTLQSLPIASRQQEVVVVPVELRWTITQQDVPPSYSKYCSPSTYINPQQWHNYLQCDCPGGGSAYLSGGCESSYFNVKIISKKIFAIIGVSASFGFVFLIWACVILYKAIKKRKMKKLRQKFFKRNGGLLLQQQLLAKEGTIEKTKIFTANELDKATDHFNADRIPISFELDDDEDRSLVSRFLLCMEENRLMEILDVQVIEQGKKEDVVAMAWLAQRCLNFNGKKRPTMKEVATELDAIKASYSHHPLAMEALEIESDFIA
nr:wall-associated receptor kinase-like 1 [Ipomoea batatas]